MGVYRVLVYVCLDVSANRRSQGIVQHLVQYSTVWYMVHSDAVRELDQEGDGDSKVSCE